MNVFAIKIFALITMLIDHLGYFFPDYFPIYTRWIGRLAAPLFIFCMVQGIQYTHSRKSYLARLYISSIIMAIGNFILNMMFNTTKVPLYNNIFTTIFLIGLIITIFELEVSKRKKILLLFTFVLVQITTLLIGYNVLGHLAFTSINSYFSTMFTFGSIIPSVFYTEGEIVFVLLGLLMYLCRKNKMRFSIMFIAVSLCFMMKSFINNGGIKDLFFVNYQWMMVCSLPIVWMYNGEKGKGLKYMFYIFYPVHIWGLFLIANCISIV